MLTRSGRCVFPTPSSTAKDRRRFEAIGRKLRVVAAVKGLRNLRIGSVGGRVPGFYASNYDELQLLDTFGISTEKLTMLEVVERARKIFADSAEPCAPVADPIRSFDITDEERRRLKALFQAFVEMAKQYRPGCVCHPLLAGVQRHLRHRRLRTDRAAQRGRIRHRLRRGYDRHRDDEARITAGSGGETFLLRPHQLRRAGEHRRGLALRRSGAKPLPVAAANRVSASIRSSTAAASKG